jgi:hypothetical protein
MEFNFGGSYEGKRYSNKVELDAFHFDPETAISLTSSSSIINVDEGLTSSSISAVSHVSPPEQLR